ncbi:MAG: hypothetical protein KKB21_05595 [Nanoarchaeota archaeon]|nr:hypothetical protein [Nanoarchaeota archaeon]MBU4087021.1 hypothetical protein [Nanoarchaeota archaeon]
MPKTRKIIISGLIGLLGTGIFTIVGASMGQRIGETEENKTKTLEKTGESSVSDYEIARTAQGALTGAGAFLTLYTGSLLLYRRREKNKREMLRKTIETYRKR